MQRYLATPVLLFVWMTASFACANLAFPATETATAEVTPTYEGCYFVWASHDLPGLSARLNAELQSLDAAASGRAYAYGEDCVYADGHQTFSALETDFKVSVRTGNLKDENTLGNWIVKVMRVVEQLPPAELQGGQPGRVDLEFNSDASESLFLRVSIDEYRRTAKGKTGAELFRLFYTNP